MDAINKPETLRAEFLKIFNDNIKREGSDKLLQYLLKSDFFTAPASTRSHCSCLCGLCEHSINTYKRLLNIVKNEYGENWENHYSHETIAICGLFHDACKIGFYRADTKNVKINGNWEKQDCFVVDDELPYGHGEKSVYVINGFIRLTRDEAMAINWHMGGFDTRVKGGSFSISDAMIKYPLIVFVHMADILSSYLNENTIYQHSLKNDG